MVLFVKRDVLQLSTGSQVLDTIKHLSVIGGLIAAIDILEKNPDIQENLHENEKYLRDGIQQIGLNVLHSESPIIPIILPDRDTTLCFADSLHQEGVYVNPILLFAYLFLKLLRRAHEILPLCVLVDMFLAFGSP
ncbi:aminotransferase class I/II-fold pyridoxal phosphate-dependent enzyme [Bacillus haynesii]|uniref:aminotransferase class I/II-fold pyridoxal phosphate-dependent enzyme n=1 Tax=Bacillus haynesii TaxID=1925021 RepID=UPI001EFAFDAD|nr:aminotransferase class I/II-fold pyridoxal phosphate-dependent enzyme [Bacillus haynesii]